MLEKERQEVSIKRAINKRVVSTIDFFFIAISFRLKRPKKFKIENNSLHFRSKHPLRSSLALPRLWDIRLHLSSRR